jgi:hypothetical protein
MLSDVNPADVGQPSSPADQPGLAPPPCTGSYFAACLGDSYTPTQYGKHEGTHPQRVREAMAALVGTKEADVIAALVFQHELERQRYERLYDEYTRGAAASDAATAEVARLREQMERAAIACAHMEAPAARKILLEALEP